MIRYLCAIFLIMALVPPVWGEDTNSWDQKPAAEAPSVNQPPATPELIKPNPFKKTPAKVPNTESPSPAMGQKSTIIIQQNTGSELNEDTDFIMEWEGKPKKKKLWSTGFKPRKKVLFSSHTGKPWRLVIYPSFSINIPTNGFSLIGSTPNIGVKFSSHYLGAAYSIMEDKNNESYSSYTDYSSSPPRTRYREEYENRFFTGGCLVYYYQGLTINNIITFAPGATAGFWFEEYDYGEGGGDDEGDEFYFLAPRVKVELGYDRIHLVSEGTMQIGTNLNFQLDFGLMFEI